MEVNCKMEDKLFNVLDVLLVVFILLKLCGLIFWSWFWVLSPLWVTIILGLVFRENEES